MTQKTNIFDVANEYIRDTEASLVNLLSAIAPWGAPLAPAYMSYGGMVKHLGFTPFVAGVIAGVIEILGLATVHTTILFWQHNRRYKADVRKMPTLLAGGMFALYLVVILTVNVAMEALIEWPGMPILARALLSLLAVPAAVTLAIRTQHAELLSEIRGNRSDKKNDKNTTNKMSGNVAQTSQNVAFARGYAGFIEYVHSLEKQGRKFDKVVAAKEMGRSTRQVERYIEEGRSNGIADQLN